MKERHSKGQGRMQSPNEDRNKDYNRNIGGSNTDVSSNRGPSWKRTPQEMQIKDLIPTGTGREAANSDGLQLEHHGSTGGFDSTVHAGLPNAKMPIYEGGQLSREAKG